MIFRFSWRLWAVIVASAVVVAFVTKMVNINQKVYAQNLVWLKKDNLKLDRDFSSLLVQLPGSDEKKVGVKIYDENNWQVYRAYPSGHLDVFFNNSEGLAERLSLSAGWRRNSYPRRLQELSATRLLN